jgi:peptidylprolyl isomerase
MMRTLAPALLTGGPCFFRPIGAWSRAMKLTFAVLPALAFLLVLTGCGATVGENKMVKMSYKGTLPNGSVFDSSEGKEPLEFLYGAGQIIPKLEAELKGMKVGDKKVITIKAADAYGEYDASAVQEVPKESFPKDMKLEVGMQLIAQTAGGPIPIRIAEIKDKTVMVDFNHPLAGKDLTFNVQIVGIRSATKQELAQAHGAAAPEPTAQSAPAPAPEPQPVPQK